MKHITHILLAMCLLLPIALKAQTPYDSFAPETSRPMLEADALYEEIVQENRQVETILCAALIDMHSQSLYLVSLVDGTLLASAPLTDEVRKWLSVDPLVDKYIYASPYMYCNGNPIINIDQHGDSSAVFIAQNGALGFGHMAIAVQNKDGKWQLYSKNGAGKSRGFSDSSKSITPNDLAYNISSPEEFLNNKKENTVTHDGQNGQYYTSYYILPTTPEQDQIIANEMTNQLQNVPYDLLNDNCTQAVQRSLQKAGVPVGSITRIPNTSMQAIKWANPQHRLTLFEMRLFYLMHK